MSQASKNTSLAQLMSPVVDPSNELYASKRKDKSPPYSRLLIRKNIILTIKNPKNLIFLVIAPFLLSLFLFTFQKLSDDAGLKSWIDNEHRDLSQQSLQCVGKQCISLMYSTIVLNSTVQKEPQWVNHTLQYIKKYSDIGNNIVRQRYITSQGELDAIRDDLDQHPNKTQIGIFFCIDNVLSQTFCNTSTNSYSYYFYLNKTDSFGTIFAAPSIPLPVDHKASALKLLIDNAILDFRTGARMDPPKIKIQTTQYPIVPNRFVSNFDIITQTGAFYYMITPLFAFLFIQNEIVREKEYRLRQGLNVFGATHFSYWISWIIISIIYSIIASFSTIAAGAAFGFRYFLDTPFWIILMFMFPFCMAMQLLSYFLSTLAPNLKAANSISYGLVLFAIVVESFTTNDSLLMFIFQDDATPLIIFLKWLLTFYPPFSYTKVFTSITNYVGHHFNYTTRKWELGTGYNWTMFTEEKKDFTVTGSPFTMYSCLNSVFVLYMNVAFFALLTWYFDNVIESNRGTSQPFYFFLKPSYWGFKSNKYKSKKTIDDLRNPTYNIRDEEESVTRERLRVNKNFNNKEPALGLRIKSLSKTFTKMCSKDRVEALRNVTLEIQPNQLMSLLGHNGAGKTTMINILTGIMAPDNNPEMDITINNINISNISEIRKYIGVCPQFDILWKEMTAEEHLILFGRMKGIPKKMLDSKIDQVLRFVSLLPEKKSRVSSFSGGMKRRLSLAIAAIGGPKIIFLDEPTTGLDPKVRQQVWSLIEKLKKRKSVILTTHSMEEADILSDRISILVKGRLKCIGTSIYLKDSYGSGYRVALNVFDGKAEEVMRLIRKLYPQAVQVDSNAGNLLIGLQQYSTLIEFVKMLESKEASGLDEYTLKQSIKDWNVSHTTLQEVFMKVTKDGAAESDAE